ncbi:polyphosphate kinase 1 [Paratractidigestivibacter sp.]|uniref:polyphosphate kinase 1 n=1 Tax=Paratractidigestivibacter sp. TaxID=2847316 RepID=UPI002ABE76F4|nr:polyphosphate kinase 1 [Paratractidigestivibacter sp.]
MGKDKNEKGSKPKAKQAKDGRDYSYTQNRELSWLRFDNRVLDEAFDERVPLFERLKFCEIFESNLTEWFMIRIGGLSDLASLKNQPKDCRSNETPAEQLESIFAALPPLIQRHDEAFRLVEGKLASSGLERVTPANYTPDDLAAVRKFFDTKLSPIVSPLVIDPRHPFPNLRSGRLFVACSLVGPKEQGLLGLIEVPTAEQRVVELACTPKRFRYTLVEDVLRACLESCFGDYRPLDACVLRVTRNADIDPDGEGVAEEEDYRQHMKKVLKMRQRLQPVRLEIMGSIDPKLEKLIMGELGLEQRRVFRVEHPLDLGFVYGIEAKIPDLYHSDVVFAPFEPQASIMVNAGKPMRAQVEDHDVLLTYPYESMAPLLQLLREASADDSCISIKITLYRVAKSSHLCESLIAAAENGKDVTVLMELRARFDEANNIAWAERLEDAGCTVIYGSEGFKCHSKICQITYHDASGISRITCLGTGNFNEKTARLYSDFMLLTANAGIAEDGNVFFRNLSLGNLRGQYKYLGVAPLSLKPLVMRGIDREIGRARKGEPAKIFLKMNSLTDRDVIDKISEACEAGVEVQMTIRGICCIKAGVPGKTDGLQVRQIVGRFLEHARIYAFGTDADLIYLSSADMMTRNTERRVEIAYPILDATCREFVKHFMELQHADNVKARQLDENGEWQPVPVLDGEAPENSQETLFQEAYARARDAADAARAIQEPRVEPAPEYGPEEELNVNETQFSLPVGPAVQACAAEPAGTAAQVSPAAPAAGAGARPGRFSHALSLIGEGIKTLFGGK